MKFEALPIEPITEDIDSLIAKRDELEMRNEKLWDDPGFPKGRDVFVHLDTQKTQEKFGHVIKRIDTETSILDEIDATIGKDNFITGLAQGKYPIDVEFDKGESLNTDPKRKEAGITTLGAYFPAEKRIRIAQQAPSSKDLWRSFAIWGTPEVARTLHHELVHHLFEGSSKKSKLFQKSTELLSRFDDFLFAKLFAATYLVGKLAVTSEAVFAKNPCFRSAWSMFFRLSKATLGLLDGINKRQSQKLGQLIKENQRSSEHALLTEVVARKSGNALGTKKKVYRQDTTRALIDALVGAYGFKKPTDIDKTIVASQVIDRMKALGWAEGKITEKIAGAHYDSKAGAFLLLESEIENEAARKGLSVENLDTLTDIGRIKRHICNISASNIALEEIINLGKEELF